MKLGVNIGFEV